MKTRRLGQSGVTLVEMLIVLALMAMLAAVLVPNVTGFLGRGKARAYDADRQLLQASVDSWRTDIGRRTGNPWPILQGGTACLGKVNPENGSPTQQGCNPYIDIGALAAEEYLRSAGAVKSANTALNTTATNTPSGSYGWYLGASGIVISYLPFVEGLYP